MNCHGLGCQSTDLIKAHIIPAGFGRLIRPSNGKNIKIAGNRVREANPQLGEFDPSILCERCDNVLGLDDEYALDVTKRIKPFRAVNEELFVDTTVDCNRFSKFALSVIWRASISKREAFSEVSLGPYENLARDVLFGSRPLSDFRQFELVVSRFSSRISTPAASIIIRCASNTSTSTSTRMVFVFQDFGCFSRSIIASCRPSMSH